MKIENNPKKYQKTSEPTQPGMTVRGKFIPYTWVVMAVGALAIVAVVIVFVGLYGGESGAEEPSDQPDETVEVVEDEPNDEPADEPADEPVDEPVDDESRMWDNYVGDGEPDDASRDAGDAEGDANADADGEADGETDAEPASEPVDNAAITATIEQFLVAYQIYGPGTSAQDRYDKMIEHGTEDAANELIPTRGVAEAEASIDVIHELITVDVSQNEGVEHEYTVTLTYTAEVMEQMGQYTDVYTIRTDGTQVTEAIVRSMTTDN